MKMKTTAAQRLARLKKGFPLSTGATPAKPPKTSGKKRATTPAVKKAASKRDSASVRDRLEQERAGGVRRRK